MNFRIFGTSVVVALIALAVAFGYAGWSGVFVCAILGVLEVSLSFDNAVINASILQRMSLFWQRMFLTVGVLIAVFGMRLVFPLVIVWATAGLDPVKALDLALNPPADGASHFADGSASYETILTDAHPQIAAFGGMFLLMLFLDFILSPRRVTWLSMVENPLARLGRLPNASVMVALAVLVPVAVYGSHDHASTVLTAGVLGLLTYLLVGGLSSLFAADEDPEATIVDVDGSPQPRSIAPVVGRAAFFMFLYLEVLDASFSFDGVIGAFAITSDPILIALGLGFIGAMFVRSITIFLVRKGTLSEYRYLEHGAHWAIGALAVILLISIGVEVSEVITGLIGVVFIGAALASSVRANRRDIGHSAAADVGHTP